MDINIPSMNSSPLMCKHVIQVGGDPKLIGRAGIVTQSFIDEKGNSHCFVDRGDGDWFWCPDALLKAQ